jgi:glutaredoxin
MTDVKIYGADWCAMTRRALGWLDEHGVEYEYIKVDRDAEASDWVKRQSGGKEKKPTLDIRGEVLVEPSNSEIEVCLRSNGLIL